MTDKLPLLSQTPLDQRLETLKTLIPEAFSEGKLDFNKLKSALGNATDTNAERYGLSWAGKNEAVRAVQIPSKGTLEPLPDKSVNFDSSQNLIIEGDNLEVLKLLQKSYYGKIKMIYIDPPYNTGNEFIYPDNFREGLEDYLVYSGQRENDGTRLSSSEEKNGRKHSKWLNMMYPRLFLARTLLKEDGVIFVSIDDNEVKNLRALMDEIFGEENVLGAFVWKRRSGSNDALNNVSVDHEYVMAARRSEIFQFGGIEKDFSNYKNPDKDPRGPWTRGDLTKAHTAKQRPNLYYPITNPETGITYQCNPNRVWTYEKKRMDRLIGEGKILWPSTPDGTPQYKRFLSEVKSKMKPVSTWIESSTIKNGNGKNGDVEAKVLQTGLNQSGTKAFGEFFEERIFDFPKPVELMKTITQQATDVEAQEDEIILDFFAGSGTTAQAVLELNREDGGSRQFILVQLPEKTGREDYKTITDICMERTRRVIKKLNDAENGSLGLNGKPDRGFKAFALRASNFKVWDGEVTTPEKLAEQLSLIADNLEPGEADEAGILFEIILKAGLPLTAAITELSLHQKVYSVEDKTLYICLAHPVQEATLQAVVAEKPQTFVCLDVAFEGNDQLKTNILLQTRNAGIRFYTV